jgi:hypothetical protein
MTLSELQTLIDPAKKKLKFTVKLFHVLKYTTQDRSLLGATGAIWCDDHVHFLANAKILAKLFHLKANSINTNFREHGLERVGRLTPTDFKVPMHLPDSEEHWWKRSSTMARFTRESTLEDAEAIPTSVPKGPPPSDAAPSAPAPPPLAIAPVPFPQMAFMEEDDVKRIDGILAGIRQPPEWKNEVWKVSMQLWCARFGAVSFVSQSTWLEKFFPFDNKRSRRDILQLRANCKSLLSEHAGCSQTSTDVYFNDYFRLFLKFGDQDGFVSTLDDVTDFAIGLPLHCGLEEEEDELEVPDVNFRNGFCFLDSSSAQAALEGAPPLSWIVTQSRIHNGFKVLLMDHLNERVAIQIQYFAVALEGGAHFSVPETENGESAFAQTWKKLLQDVLRLDLGHGRQAISRRHPVPFVGRTALAQPARLSVAQPTRVTEEFGTPFPM